MGLSTNRTGRWRTTKTLLLPLLCILLLALVNGGVFVGAEDVEGGDDEDNFPVAGDINGNPFAPPSPDPTSIVPVTSSLPEPTSVTASLQLPKPMPTTPSGILKPGTSSVDCAVIADLYRATGPWRFVPDTVNCCNADYPNSSGIKCNANNQIIYIYLADLSHNRLSGSLPSSAAAWINLGTLNVEQNALTGSVPDWITTLPNLHSLAIGQNLFTTGDPPPSFTFHIEPVASGSVNNITIPSVNPADVVPAPSTFLESFTRLPKLRQLKLDSLGVSGGFPASWQQKMVNLTKLDLSNNSMQGQIPGFINGFTGLKTLLLDRNEFGGPIPSLESLRSLSANNYFVCTEGPEQVLSAKWSTDCKALCTDVQQTVPTVRPAINTTLPEIRVKQTHNDASIQYSTLGSLARWVPLAMALWLSSMLH
ncbi:hypothetical protein BGX27_001841 [Mortierella sp. AM989]|nr:hypothetical protein BGX27_001841 [Mortierella sp. AM989]